MEHIAGLLIDTTFRRFVEDEVLVDLDISPADLWAGLAGLVSTFAPRNRALLHRREELQAAIDDWYRRTGPGPVDVAAHTAFLEDIGYLLPEPPEVQVTTAVADAELHAVAGPQLVVPVDNPRYALNAANARWGSLYDAVYGTDVLGDRPVAGGYDGARGDRVVRWVRALLDEVVPLEGASHADVRTYAIEGGQLAAVTDLGVVGLADRDALYGWEGPAGDPAAVWLQHHGLRIVLVIDRADPVGAAHPAGLRDVLLEAAVSVIMDAEDSVAAVDADDKVGVYRSMLGLMRGDLEVEVPKGDRTVRRRLAAPRSVRRPDGTTQEVRGTALMLFRTVGLLMDTPIVTTADGQPIPEGILDALITPLIALHDRSRPESLRNSRDGSVHIVKPKLHGPEEVAFTVELFAAVERVLGLEPRTITLGLMDEERRTTLNLRRCVAAAADRLVFINTGFLDRTGDEIHTCMEAGPVLRKGDMKAATWLQAYEDHNVDVGLAVGLAGRGQIGKGMWAAPDDMAAMLAEKGAHPRAGASCAWVPSPTAATLHAIHYHRVDVRQRQEELRGRPARTRRELLAVPVVDRPAWTDDERIEELENNLQGILGYVSRWVTQGVGCSKVPDIHGQALMEDRATCRISSQHVANWLHHGVVSAAEVADALRRMAAVVDAQNRDNPGYQPMMPAATSPAFLAASDLVMRGRTAPSGYTEPTLHARRAALKAMARRADAPGGLPDVDRSAPS